MSPHLAKILFERYPFIFAERHLSAGQFCMSRGIETGDGWFELIDSLCTMLQWDTDHDIPPNPWRSRSSSLRFRIRHPTESQHMEMLVLELSTRLCEAGGAPRVSHTSVAIARQHQRKDRSAST